MMNKDEMQAWMTSMVESAATNDPTDDDWQFPSSPVLLKPRPGDIVTLHLRGYLRDGTTIMDTQRRQPLRLQVGQQQLVPGLDAAVRECTRGQTVDCICRSQDCHGLIGFPPAIPPNTTVGFKATVVHVDSTQRSIPLAERQRRAQDLKVHGTKCFKAELYELASKCYKAAYKQVARDVTSKDLKVSLLSNLALCALRRHAYHTARDRCNRVLALDGTHIKALYRKALASHALEDHQEAVNLLEKVLKLDPKNKAASAQLIQCKQAMASEC
eukprot:m.145216 g.145216  ORF g.145216 m.145216 type:complete len:271 (-) comp16215_c0_seq8:2889-3701(-)